ncbi:MAG: methyltransferase [Proteobacteria bacterium]|nr:methyltransferase [Pseudomonadota bacterium]
METTEGALLGGRVPYRQPAAGFRSGIEPVLLAAAIPARRGERVLEAGTGAGAALLCLTARVAGLLAVGIERDSALAALAAHNLAAAGQLGAHAVVADAAALPLGPVFDHALGNPPYHAGGGTPSPDPARRVAKEADAALFARWTAAMAGALRHRGTLTLILPAAAAPAAMAAMAASGCAADMLFPFWPMEGRPAKLVLLRGAKGGRSPFRVLPGLVLHAADGAFTAPAQAILRGEADLTDALRR